MDSEVKRLSATGLRPIIVALCGTSTASTNENELALRVGELCAQKGALVLCGGLAGVMSSGAEGVRSAGGIAIGLLPGDDPDEGNEFLSFAIPTGLGEMRNGLLAKASRGMIAIGGGYGTLSEIGFMRRLGRPVACIASWGIHQPGETNLDEGIYWASNPEDAVTWLWNEMTNVN